MRAMMLSALLLVLTFTPAQADGLVYRMPEDGIGAVFDFESTYEYRGKPGKDRGSLTISAVGKQDLNGEACRWIEFHWVSRGDEGNERMLYKALIPEAVLQSGHCPMDHIRKCWWSRRDEKPRLIVRHPKDEDWGFLPIYLSGPPKNLMQLEATVLESPLGKLACKGIRGNLLIEQERLEKMDLTMETWLHEQAPFGVVQSRMEYQLEDRGQRGKGVMTFKLIEVRKNIRSEWPDHH